MGNNDTPATSGTLGNCFRVTELRLLLRDVPGPHGVPLVNKPFTLTFRSRNYPALCPIVFSGSSDDDGLIVVSGNETSASTNPNGIQAVDKNGAPLDQAVEFTITDSYILHTPGHDLSISFYRPWETVHEDRYALTAFAYYPGISSELYERDKRPIWESIPEKCSEQLDKLQNLEEMNKDSSGAAGDVDAGDTGGYGTAPLLATEVRRNDGIRLLPHCKLKTGKDTPITVIADTFWTPFKTFSKMRFKGKFIPYRDGEEYLRQAAYLVDAAESFIYITDLMFNPTLPLTRRGDDEFKGLGATLESLLVKKLENNPKVKVYIHIYDCISFAVNMYNTEVYQYLLSVDSGLRKYLPDNALYRWFNIDTGKESDVEAGKDARVFFLSERPGLRWAHHQKMIAADISKENIIMALVGGIDVCQGRWDDGSHSVITSPKPFTTGEAAKIRKPARDLVESFPTQYYLGVANELQVIARANAGLADANEKIEARTLVEQYQKNEFGGATNFAPAYVDEKIKRFMLPQRSDMYTPKFLSQHRHLLTVLAQNCPRAKKKIESDLKARLTNTSLTSYPDKLVWYFSNLSKTISELSESCNTEWFSEYKRLGKEQCLVFIQEYVRDNLYYNNSDVQKRIDALSSWEFLELADTNYTALYNAAPHPELYPRMPWHDVACGVFGPAAVDLCEAFVQKWNKGIQDTIEYPIQASGIYMGTMPLNNIFAIPQSEWKLEAHKSAAENSYRGEVQDEIGGNRNPGKSYSGRIQVQRSSDARGGSREREQTLYYALRQAIRNARRFIYIENQFFSCENNSIANDIAARVISAIDNGELFRVYLLLPPFPEESWIKADASIIDKMQKALWKGGKSLLRLVGQHLIDKGQLDKATGERIKRGSVLFDAENMKAIYEYIGVFSLRNENTKIINGLKYAMTERIYIHSKLLIVDDRVAIISSANINDRSLLAGSETELGVTIMGDGKREGAYYIRQGVYDLRRALWEEHLGGAVGRGSPTAVKKELLDDPLSDVSWQLWHDRARENTAYYAKKYDGLPGPCYLTPQSIDGPYIFVKSPSNVTDHNPDGVSLEKDPVKVELRQAYFAYLAYHLQDGFTIKREGGDGLNIPPPAGYTPGAEAAGQTGAFKTILSWKKRDYDMLTIIPPSPKGHLVYYPLAWLEGTDAFSEPSLFYTLLGMLPYGAKITS